MVHLRNSRPDREQRSPTAVAAVSRTTELSRVVELADHLAIRTPVAFDEGALSTEEFRANPDVALVLDAARLLHAARAEFPAGVVRLAQKAVDPASSALIQRIVSRHIDIVIAGCSRISDEENRTVCRSRRIFRIL